MEIVGQQLSDGNAFGSNYRDVVKSDASSTSSESSSGGCLPPVVNCSDDDEVLLASNVPKKRAGRKVFKETRHPIYRGVRQRNKNKWVCELRVPDDKKTRLWLGTYPTAEMAARAHDVAALALRGKAACVNFADSAWRLRVPASKDAHEIRKAAAEAAESFGDSTSTAESWMKTTYNDEVSSRERVVEAVVPTSLDDFTCTIGANDEYTMLSWPHNVLDGPLLSPTPCVHDSMQCWNEVEMDVQEIPLWNFSIEDYHHTF